METNNLVAQFPFASNQPSVPTKVSRATWAGLAIALFAMVAIRQVFVFFVPETTFASAVLKEALIWVSALALILIIRRGEHLPMRSIGLGTARWWKSILWGFIIAIVSAVAVGALAYVTGYGHGPGSAAFEKLPLWLITAIVFRAGVVEELFYRGYAIERLQMVGLGRFWSVAIPLVIFSLGHWSGGAANHRIRSRLNPHRILSAAARSGGQHDRSRFGGFCCQRPAEIVFLTSSLRRFRFVLKSDGP
jgi:CAAX protease family protein